jgi:hypothetical protein
MAYTTINKSSLHFNANKWSGNSSTQAITGVGFQPDFVWLKQGSGTQRNQLIDAVRGTNVILKSDGNDASGADTDILNSFDSDGYTLGYQDQSNDTGATYVGLNWKANGQGSSNTDGSINTTYTSANTTSGFSICKWTGSGANATIGHGLGVVPKMIMVKNLATTDSWNVYHESIGNNKRVFLDTSGAESTTSDAWNTTSPTTSVFSVGTNTGTNKSGDALIAYCFAEKKGFSKFGSYVGNGNVDGVFIYTGFKPKFLMTKYSSGGGTGGWLIYNGGLNTVNKDQFFHTEANTSAAWVDNTDRVDFLSNGFKFRDSTNGDSNTNGGTYIYMAFAEAPLVGSNNVPATAR